MTTATLADGLLSRCYPSHCDSNLINHYRPPPPCVSTRSLSGPSFSATPPLSRRAPSPLAVLLGPWLTISGRCKRRSMEPTIAANIVEFNCRQQRTRESSCGACPESREEAFADLPASPMRARSNCWKKKHHAACGWRYYSLVVATLACLYYFRRWIPVCFRYAGRASVFVTAISPSTRGRVFDGIQFRHRDASLRGTCVTPR